MQRTKLMNRFFLKPRSGGARIAAAGAVSAVLALGIAACGGSSSGSSDGSGGTVSVVGYSTPQELYEQDAEPAFQATADGSGVEFRNSFGASGDQSRAVEAGLPADIMHFALAPDMDREVEAGLVNADWDAGQYKGIVQDSVVVFAVRPGNPDNITTWDQVVSGDFEVVTPNPFTSGGARWNIMAAYGAQVAQGKSDADALQGVADMLGSTVVQDASARDALQTFIGGQGDVLLTYENEAIQAQAAGEELDYVVPDQTILIETPFAQASKPESPTATQAFYDYMFSAEGQKLFAERGFRPVDQDVLAQYADKFPEPKDLFTIDDLGGWDKVTTDFFDTASGSIADIEANLGVATE
jgi:sulfate transport system substrate-binding protein